jgi:hypothetical protein
MDSASEIYDPAVDLTVSFDDAVAFYMREAGMTLSQAKFHVGITRDENYGEERRVMPDGSVIIVQA